ncbi:MAG TPA: ABC transporter permease [Microthrixaceae bacterium]|nr:ABC transporter permease [Microthrixaceae bacterium]
MRSLFEFLTTSENWSGTNGIAVRLGVHLWVSFLALGASALVSIPAGIAFGHAQRGQVVATGVANIGRAIPSLAVLAFVVAAGGGIGFFPTFVAMFALAVPPLFVSASTAVSELDPAVLEVGRGLGMRQHQLVRRVEVPLATPLILSGARIATSQVIATATLGAFVGYNTLGRFITVGRANRDDAMLYGGVVLVVTLALIAELGFWALQRALTPWNRRRESNATASS